MSQTSAKRLYIFINPSARAGYDTRSIFKGSLTGLNSEFSLTQTSCLTKAEDISLPYYLPIAGGRIIGCITFPRVLVLCEMQSVWSSIWTRVAVSIYYDHIHYTTRHDWVGTVILLELSKKLKLDHTTKWYMLTPELVLKNERHKILWDFETQTGRLIPSRRPDQVRFLKNENFLSSKSYYRTTVRILLSQRTTLRILLSQRTTLRILLPQRTTERILLSQRTTERIFLS